VRIPDFGTGEHGQNQGADAHENLFRERKPERGFASGWDTCSRRPQYTGPSLTPSPRSTLPLAAAPSRSCRPR
jgi:hypothetical protein